MIVQVYLTAIFVTVVAVLVVGAVFGRPFLRRWRLETRIEQEEKARADELRRERLAAERELDEALMLSGRHPEDREALEERRSQ
jgi:uncharacterized membrane protein YcjF (UPF0283 family)